MTKEMALGFVLYDPPVDAIRRIIEAAGYGFTVYIYINSICEERLEPLLSHKTIILSHGHSNGGLSEGLARICNAAFESEYEALLYFDQDTVFERVTLDYISAYCHFVLGRPDALSASVVCTTFRDIPHSSRLNHISYWQRSGYNIENVFFTINSGSLYSLRKLKAYEWFDRAFFVDGVDYSFCIASIRHGYKIAEVHNTPGIDHDSAQGNLAVSVFGRKIVGRVYPVGRNVGFILAHIRLLCSAFTLRSMRPPLFVMKSLLSYLFQQFLFRVRTRG
jgi:rhamnosyltransferase